MMRKVFVLIILLAVGACSNPAIEKVDVYEMAASSESKQKTLVTFTNSETINVFVEAFSNAVKEPGIVDMIDPGYQVKVDGKTHFLWIDKEYGIIMDSKDTHTIYSLSNESTIKIHDLLSK